MAEGISLECTSCGRENRDDARFCAGCGTALSRSCAACDRELAPDAAFCDGCGTPVESGADGERAAVRKTVTALFCDLAGSTSFGERVDAESTREAMSRYHAMAQAVIEQHDGTLAKFIGDGVMALFGVPEVGPDDAERAVRAGLALQAGFGDIRAHVAERYGVELELRVGINTGEVVIADDDADIVGDAVNTAARLEAACDPGKVLVGESTFRLTRGAADFVERGAIQAKGKDEPVAAFEVVGAHAALDEAEELATPFVGRDDELHRLRLVLEDTILERRAALVSVIGSPGVGKTRLAREMRAAVEGGTRAFELRCERSGTATFAPIAELLRVVAGITDAHAVDEMTARVRAVVAGLEDADRVGELLCGFVGAGPMRSTEEMFLAVRRLFEALGREQPIVLVVDDIQWAEPLFLDLLEHLAEWVQSVPLLVVCLARPEIREVRPVLTEQGRRVAAVVNLEGLSVTATTELAARLVGADALPRELLARIPESTEGNPLFVRELMRMLVDDGVISDASGRWEMVIDVEAVEVPPTINSLLASRVERMSPEERRVLELASVVGSEFPIGAVEAAGEGSRRDLEAAFERLRRKELIEPTGSYWGDEPVYRFHHVLIRDAAYRRLLKGARAELHTAVGEWTEQTATALVGEHEVAIANHFEQAHLYRLELDLDDKETKALGERAARLFHVAAARALEREDLAAAASLASRALGCVDDEDAQIAELLLLGCEAVLGVGDVASGAPLVDRLAAVAGDDDRLGAWVDCFRAQVAVLTDPEGLHDAEQRADDAARRLEQLGDSAGVAKARIQRAGALVRLARVGECENELDLALSAARAVDDRRRVTAVLGNAPVAALWGPSPVPRAGGRCLDVVRLLRITTGSPAVEATSIRCQAVLEALRGRYDTARSMLDTARSTVEELGLTHDLLETQFYGGLVELLADNPAAAEPLLRAAHDGLGRMGIGADRGQAGANLARALLLLDRLDEAEELATESQRLAGQNLQTAIAARSVRAEILSARGSHDEALVLADEAVAAAVGSDILVDQANAVAAQARVRAAAGDAAGAAAAAEAANGLYQQKGATITVDVGQVVPVDRPAPRPAATSPSSSAEVAWNDADRLARQLLRQGAPREEWLAAMADDVVFEDRRSLIGARYDGPAEVVEGFLDGIRQFGEFGIEIEPIAVRGEELLVFRGSLTGAAAEVSWLAVNEARGGNLLRSVLFDGDDFNGALAELDRLYASTLPLEEALRVREVAEYQAAVGRGDLEALLATVPANFVAVDHRNAAWPQQSYDGWADRVRSLLDVAPGIVGIAERIHSASAEHLLFTQVWRFRDEAGGEQISRFLCLSFGDAAVGATSRAEFFELDDLALAEQRIVDYGREREGQVAPNLATVVGGYVNARVSAGLDTQEFVVDPARLDVEPLGLGVLNRRVVATGGEHLALIEVELRDGTWAFSVEEVDEEGRLVDWRLFAADALKDAVDHAADRFVVLEADEATKVAAAFAAAMRGFDSVALTELMADDYESVDHRWLAFPPLTRADLLQLADDSPVDQPVLVPVEVIASDARAVLSRTAMYDGEAGSLTDGFAALTVTSIRDGKVTRTEHFAEADLDAAMARFREVTGDRWPAGDEPWNKADRFTREWATTGDVAELLGPDVEFEDRRRLVGEPGEERIVLTVMRRNVMAQHVSEIETIAVRGNLLSLHRMKWRSDGGRDLEWELLTVAEFTDDGSPARAVVFEVEQLPEALAELHRMHIATRDPVADAAEISLHEIRERGFAAMSAGDVEGLAAGLAEDIAFVDHRPASFGSITGRDRMVDGVTGFLAEVDSIVAYAERGLVISGMVVRYTGCYRITTPHGAEILDRRQVVAVSAEDGRVVRLEEFPAEQVDEAIARWEELVAESEPAVDGVARRILETNFSRDLETWSGLVDDALVVRDLRSGLHNTTIGKEAAVEAWWQASEGLWGDVEIGFDAVDRRGPDAVLARISITDPDGEFAGGFLGVYRVTSAGRCDAIVLLDEDAVEQGRAHLDGLAAGGGTGTDDEAWNEADRIVRRILTATGGRDFETVAVRGDDLVLHHVTQGNSSFVLHRVAGGEAEQTGAFDSDDLPAALAELDRLHVESLPPGEARQFEFVIGRPYRELTAGELDRVVGRLNPDFRMVEHRRLAFADGDRDALQERVGTLHDVADRVVALAERVHRMDEVGTVMDICYRVEMPDGAGLTQRSTLFNGSGDWSGVELCEQFDEGGARDAIAAAEAWKSTRRWRPTQTLATATLYQLNTELQMPRSRLEDCVADPERLVAADPQPFRGGEGRMLATAGRPSCCWPRFETRRRLVGVRGGRGGRDRAAHGVDGCSPPRSSGPLWTTWPNVICDSMVRRI